MSARLLHPDEYELGSRSSLDSEGTFNLDDDDFEAQAPPFSRLGTRQRGWLPWIFSSVPGYRRLKTNTRPILASASRLSCSPRFVPRRRCCYLHVIFGVLLGLVFLTSIFFPSYTRPPPHYVSLRKSMLDESYPGRGNPHNQTVFIAASLYDRDGDLAGGQWGDQLLQLIELLGNENVFVSIYENDSGADGEKALRELEKRIPCEKSVVFEEHLDFKSLPAVTVPGGDKRVKRIEYLAQVRNRALQPLDDHPEIQYDKLLYLNDILYDPVDAIQLLFSTNHVDGVSQYRAACSVDFDNPFKFYDTYATRDLHGYSMGLPFFPWFSTAGGGESRKDVLQGKDAVRVRSCWGGMVAFDAKYFQHSQGDTANPSPVRFRSGPDLFWEASECCLIHADIQDPQTKVDEIKDTGIYMNPYVRVAYKRRTLNWLGTTRRIEKLYSVIQKIGNTLVGLPWHNPRRAVGPGENVQETVWVPDNTHDGGGSFQKLDRVAGNDGYCGRRGLQVVVEDRQPGQKGWENIPVPPM